MTDIQKEFVTIDWICEREGVRKDRAYKMLRQYGISAVRMGPHILLIPVSELHKIPPREERAKRKGGRPYHKKNRNNGSP